MNKTFTNRLNQVLATLLLFTAMMTGHNAWAQSITTWAELQQAIDDVEADGTVTLTQNITAGANDTYINIPQKNLTIDLNGYTIDRNLTSAVSNGCVIYKSTTLTLTIKDSSIGQTGKITGGNNTDNGGGIWSYSYGTIVIEGGTITGNNARNGGGIFRAGGTFTMTGGTITGNTATKGGGIYLDSYCKFTLSGGNITNNNASENGGGIYFNRDASRLNLSGNPTISGNTRGSSANNIFLYTDKVITINGPLTNTIPFGISMETIKVFTSGLNGMGSTANFIADDQDYTLALNDDGEAMLFFDLSGGITTWAELQRAINKVPSGDTIKLTQDVIAEPSDNYLDIPQKYLTIDLNGYKIDRNLTSAISDGCVIRKFSTLTFTIMDSSEEHTGKITGGNTTGFGGGIWAYSNGALIIEGGSITGNNAKNGGGIYWASGSFTMTGGSFTGNTAIKGGGIYLDSYSKFTLSGGDITNNNASDNGGGIYFNNDASRLNLSNNPNISGNKKGSLANNVYLPNGKVITIADTLSNEVPIGVTMQTPGTFTSGLDGYGTTDNFASDDESYEVSLNGTEAMLSEPTQYDITIANDIIGGSITSSKSQALLNETIFLTIAPDLGNSYFLTGISIEETETGDPVLVKCNGFLDDTATFTMPAANVTVHATFTQTWTADSGLYINIPASGTTPYVIPEGVASFKVYDDGGKDGRYTQYSNGFIQLNAPEYCVFQITGTITANNGDKVTIYDGTTYNDPKLLDQTSSSSGATTNIGTVSSTGRDMLIHFRNYYSGIYAGLDLIVTVVNTNKYYDIILENPAEGGFVTTNKTNNKARINDTINLTATPDNGYLFNYVDVVGENSGNISITDGRWYIGTTASFIMPGEDVTVTPNFINDLTAEGGLYVNMIHRHSLTANIPNGVISFKVYDDGGANGKYTSNSNDYLLLAAPAGYLLQLSGSIATYNSSDYGLSVFDGTTESSAILIDGINSEPNSSTDIPAVVSTGQNMLLHFKSGVLEYAGLDLTAKMGHTITLPDDLTGGIVSANLDFASDGETVTLTATPSSCYHLKALTYSYGDNNPIDITESKSFAMPAANVTINAIFALSEGIDIQESCDSYTWIDGITYVEDNNVATYAVLTEQGCDSIVTLNLTINHSENIIHDPVTACDSYSWHGVTYTESQTLTFDTVTEHGCTHHETLALTVNHANTGIYTKEACDSFTWIDGITYTESNNSATYTIVGGNQYGCDSVVTLNLTVNKSYNNGNKYIFTCDSYTWNGTEYTEPGDYEYHGQTAHGCDSTVVLHLHLDYSDHTGTETKESCDSYEWHGETYTESGNYEYHTFTTKGCDSTVTLHLTINHSNTGIDNHVACDSYTWIDGNVYTESNNTATYTKTNAAGCDSVVTLNLIVNKATYGTDVQTACNIYTWIDGIDYTEDNNSATFTLENQYGCDSIVTLNLTVFHTENVTLEPVTICDSYEFDGVTYTESQVITTERTDTNGCTYTETLNLTVNHAEDVTLEPITACDSYEYNGQTYTESQVFTSELTDGNGCSYTQTQVLTINHAEDVTLEPITTCDSYEFDGVTYTESQVITTERTDANGCTYTETLNLTINHAEDVTLEPVTTCDSYEFEGVTYTESQVITTERTDANGCTYTETLNLTINHAEDVTLEPVTTCDSYEFEGVTYTESQVITTERTDANGCTYTETLNLTINHAEEVTIEGNTEIVAGDETTLTASEGASYEWSNGETTQSITVAPVVTTTYTVIVTDANGCVATAEIVVSVDDGIGENTPVVNVYPNPTKNVVNVESDNITNIRVTDMQGQILYETNASGNKVKIDLSGYAVGQYFLQVSTPNGVKIEKVVRK